MHGRVHSLWKPAGMGKGTSADAEVSLQMNAVSAEVIELLKCPCRVKQVFAHGPTEEEMMQQGCSSPLCKPHSPRQRRQATSTPCIYM